VVGNTDPILEWFVLPVVIGHNGGECSGEETEAESRGSIVESPLALPTIRDESDEKRQGCEGPRLLI
jgi:hypothetical protein